MSVAVSFGLHMEDAHTHAGGEGLRAVLTAVVSHDDFASDVVLAQ